MLAGPKKHVKQKQHICKCGEVATPVQLRPPKRMRVLCPNGHYSRKRECQLR
jgi:hypothetical protein